MFALLFGAAISLANANAKLTTFTFKIVKSTDYARPVRKSLSLHSRKSNPNPKFIGTAEAYFVWHIGPKFQVSLIHAFIGCP